MRLSPRLHRSFIETRPKSASRNRTFLFIRLTGREAPTDICLHFGSPPHCILTRPHGTVSHVSLRSFARQSSPSAVAVVGNDHVPGRLCSRCSHAVYPCNRHRPGIVSYQSYYHKYEGQCLTSVLRILFFFGVARFRRCIGSGRRAASRQFHL